MTASQYGKDKYVAPSVLEYQLFAAGIICTSSNSNIEDWIDDGEIFTIEENTNF